MAEDLSFNNMKPEVPPGQPQSQLDVYARPYVPLKWRQFNIVASTPVPCKPAPWIDFDRYVQSFAGNTFLQPRPLEIHPSVEQSEELPAIRLDPDTYSRFFATALRQERDALQQEYDDHALYNVPLVRANEHGQSFYWLRVPGLRETSLRIEIGDIVHIRQLRFDYNNEPIIAPAFRDQNGNAIQLPNSIDKRHDAVVWGIDRLRELLYLQIDSLAPRSLVFNASFTIQTRRMNELRLAIQEAQQRLDQPENKWIRSILFPDVSHGQLQHNLNPLNPNISLHDSMLNYEQTRAVDTVLKDDYGRVPYLVSGPPGTGKTKTAVENALQLVARDKTSRLIVCAPSDPASDTLIQRLSKHLSPKELLRINSPSRSFPEVPNTILPFCHVENDVFSLPPFAQLMEKRIVVITCRDVEILRKARLSNEDLFHFERNFNKILHPEGTVVLPKLHWTGLIIDEAAQATEPEALLPLLLIAPPHEAQTNGLRVPLVVMVGDQNQLGPRTACKNGPIRTSLFERLLARQLYRDHPLARSKQSGGTIHPLTSDMLPIVRPPFADLIRNYRSHPAILAMPSSLFYNDTLEPSAERTDSLLSWSGFDGRQLPILFADNRTPDEIEGDGGGWFNVGEANLAFTIARSLVREGMLQPHEICMMSPFSAQVRVLRMKSRDPEVAMPTINIGPLEAFQGLESRLVILCTTRTRDRFIDQDIARGLGVIHEPKRFNVALTRAKEGLIVIGNPHVLGQDPNWASFIAFCLRNHANNGWSGSYVDDWQPPAGSKIEISRLEKQLSYRTRVDIDYEPGPKARNRLAFVNFGMSEEEAFYESGIQAEEAMREDECFEEN